MNQELLQNTPPIIRDYLIYNEIVKGKSSNTVSEYYSDLQTFFRYLLRTRGMVDSEIPFQKITIERVDLELIRSVTISDLYAFLVFCKEERSNNATTRARKVSSLRLFFRYLTNYVHLLEKNPAELLDTPKIRQALPKHLTLEDSISLLECIDGPYKERDFCIITIFLNCGLRLSELCGLNLTDIRPDGTMRVLGKGNKERIVYLNQSCIDAIQAYLAVRPNDQLKDADRNALFISR
ncbi:MAG: tyrosine-type recombinase/integrase, partial [Clostridia bacterium]|nr:tyrosine-type recombinase/integrase [Clostridia bacterium]